MTRRSGIGRVHRCAVARVAARRVRTSRVAARRLRTTFALDRYALQREPGDEHGRRDDRDVGDIADEELVVVDEVDDVPPAGARLAQHAVGEIAEGAPEDQAERPRPTQAADAAAGPD